MNVLMTPLVKFAVIVVVVGVCVALYMMYAHANKSAKSAATVAKHLVTVQTKHDNMSKEIQQLKTATLGSANHNESDAPTCATAWKTSAKFSGTGTYTTIILGKDGYTNLRCNFVADPINARWQMTAAAHFAAAERIVHEFHLDNVGESVAEDCTILYGKPTVNAQSCVRGVLQSGKVIIYNGAGTVISFDSNQSCSTCKPVAP
jgi:hypothetical protein